MFNFNSATYEDVLKALKGLDDINVLYIFLQNHHVDTADENGKINKINEDLMRMKFLGFMLNSS